MKFKLIILVLLPISLIAQNGFVINGNLKGLGNNKLRVFYLNSNGKTKLDTITPFSNDQFLWKGNFNEPQIIRIEVLDTTQYLRVGKAVSLPPPITLLLSNSVININGDAHEIYKADLFSNDSLVKEYETYRKEEIANTESIWNLQKVYNRKLNENDTVGNGELIRKRKSLYVENQQMRLKFIKTHPKSFISVLMLSNLTLVVPPSELKYIYSQFGESVKNSNAGKLLFDKIESLVATAIGKPLINFSQVGYDGNVVNTAELKGKVIILDFWGSWCVPCRKSHPGLKKIYEKYHAKGLEIIGIANESAAVGKSKEEQTKSWQKAIHEDKLPWLQVLYDEAKIDLVKMYEITGYPTKFVIDQNGRFVLKVLGGSENSEADLEKKIAELLSN